MEPLPLLLARAPFPILGILGGGQLGRMLAAAALRLGVGVRTFQTEDSGAAAGSHVFTGAWADTELMRAFATGCHVVTAENEWVELDAVMRVDPAARILPTPTTLELVRNKLVQKQHAEASGLPLGPFCGCDSPASLDEAATRLGYPMVVKRPQRSYDGYGNRTVHDRRQLLAAYADLSDGGVVLVEAWVDFASEIATVVARRPSGEHVVYPLATTIQQEHRCVSVEVPASIPDWVAARARRLAVRAADAFGCVGVVGVEMFELRDGSVLLNEIAPRPHNSGHYTIDACVTSQFENHVRAILDLPLGDTTMLRPAAVMVNVLGRRRGPSSFAAMSAALEVPGAAVHVYGKREVRPGRKIGHVTAVADDLAEARARAHVAAHRLEL